MSQQQRLSLVLLVNVVMITGLIIVGLTAHSLGVLAAGGDFVADSLAIVLGLLAVHMRDNHGKQQAPTYVALLNGLLLFSITIFVIFQAVDRLLVHNPEVHGLPVLVVSVISALAMVVGVFILGRSAGKEDLHMRSVLLDTISDGLSALAVAVVGGIIYFTHGMYWLDSIAALAVSMIIGFGAIKLLIDVYFSLYKKVPTKIDRD